MSNTLQTALKAGLPLICVYTEDTVNFGDILGYFTDSNAIELTKDQVERQAWKSGSSSKFYYSIDPSEINFTAVYGSLVEYGKTLVIVNPEEFNNCMFNAGAVQLPKPLLKSFLSEFVMLEDIKSIMDVLGGLTLKDIGEICRLTMMEYHELTPKTIVDVRRRFVSRVLGISQVDTDYIYYKPEKALDDWLAVDGKIFLSEEVNPVLIPRGLLLGGVPGTGKTMGAKYLANQLQLPLYHLDLGSMLGKYVGESENNLNNALSIIDQSEPCVVLIDEVEKVFQGGSEDTGIGKRLLSALLWWLQEHKSRVLTIMTTNNEMIIPPELFRPGRIDKCLSFGPIQGVSAMKTFAIDLLELLVKPYEADSIMEELEFNTPESTPAEITQYVYQKVKEFLVNINS